MLLQEVTLLLSLPTLATVASLNSCFLTRGGIHLVHFGGSTFEGLSQVIQVLLQAPLPSPLGFTSPWPFNQVVHSSDMVQQRCYSRISPPPPPPTIYFFQIVELLCYIGLLIWGCFPRSVFSLENVFLEFSTSSSYRVFFVYCVYYFVIGNNLCLIF